MIKEIYEETELRMTKTIEALNTQLNKIRTGRANPVILDDVKVNYYGQMTPLKQLASISVPDPNMIVVHPWDKNILSDLEKIIQTSQFGLNPQNDGNVLRIYFPPLSEERRKELVKNIKKIGEEAKAALRNIRHDEISLLKDMEKDGDISEDELHAALDKVQEITEKFTDKIEKIIEDKEKEIMEI